MVERIHVLMMVIIQHALKVGDMPILMLTAHINSDN